ncbi:unnamed protein product [Caretta caretta]
MLMIPFKSIGLDLVGPLEKSSMSHKYILIVVNYATQYPEAVPLRAATAPTIANELLQIFSRVRLPC